MDHNLTERKIESRKRAETEGAPPGWRVDGARFSTVDTPEGLQVRGGSLSGKCLSRPECSRHVQVDLDYWIAHGFGAQPLSWVRPFYACSRLSGCKLELRETYPGGVPLFALLQESPDIALQLSCKVCPWNRSWLVATLIERLRDAGSAAPTWAVTLSRSASCAPAAARLSGS